MMKCPKCKQEETVKDLKQWFDIDSDYASIFTVYQCKNCDIKFKTEVYGIVDYWRNEYILNDDLEE